MKNCTRCLASKAEDAFSPNGKNRRHPVCKACRAEMVRLARAQSPEVFRAQERQRHAQNPEVKKQSIKRHYAANREHILAREQARYAEKSETIKAAAKQYREQNPEKVREWNGTRRAQLRKACPQWSDRGAIRRIYAEASALWESTGIPHHVDHAIPLTHPLVCGLHVPANLEVLRGDDNLRKSNRFSA